ncbi:MAG TPA: hypothetical protein VKD69_07205, partial [Vicinamibacterales bacterium]|nr:hypothetical protein [Vicinamibacterales bacterium]
GYTESVVTRIASLLVALVMAGAPVAREICQITCHSAATQSAAAHVCHEQSGASHHVLAQHGACDHEAEITAPGVAGRQSHGDGCDPPLAPAITSAAFVQDHASISPPLVTSRDRVTTPFATPLRI